MRKDFRPTIENIDIALAQCADLIERLPAGDKLWPIFDRLEAEREKLIGRSQRLEAARQRVRAQSPDQREGRS